MKKLLLPAILTVGFALVFTASSCNERVCIRCTKIQDANDFKDICTSDQNKRNDFIVEWTHQDYNCATVEE